MTVTANQNNFAGAFRPAGQPFHPQSHEAGAFEANMNALKNSMVAKNEEEAFNKLKAVFGGTHSDEDLRAACKPTSDDGNIDIDSIIDRFLTNHTASFTAAPSKESGSTGGNDKVFTSGANQPTPPMIDLGGGDSSDAFDKDTQTAVQNSLGTTNVLGAVSKDEMELSKAIEESMRADSVGFKTSQYEHPNPYERARHSVGCPVGLKNIGNSCWFSVVIQALFHLNAFRNKVLSWTSPKVNEEEGSEASQAVSQQQEFMTELRKLFALLLASTRKYADPSKVFDVLQKHEKQMVLSNGVYNNQQDVSEFTHRLLDWMEQAFEKKEDILDSAGDTENRKSATPIQEMFYGSKEETKKTDQGDMESRESEFAQYPLQVTGCGSLHESIEDSLCPQMEQPDTSFYEHWIKKLPPVFLFELGRFHFNQTEQKTEKIHSPFSFPKEIFMDRYLSTNKDTVREMRGRVKQLRAKLKHLKSKLNQYENYGSGAKKIPLVDVLESCMDFVRSARSHDVVMASPASSSSTAAEQPVTQDVSMSTSETVSTSEISKEPSLPSNSPPMIQKDEGTPVPMETDSEAPGTSSESDATKPGDEQNGKEKEKDLSLDVNYPLTPPHPGHVTESEQATLQECMTRWKQEVEEAVRTLKLEIEAVETELNKMYETPDLSQQVANVESLVPTAFTVRPGNHPYRLHSVLVHQGQASTGHYWSFVYDPLTSLWRKFDDTRVTESSWESLAEDSMGQRHAASAYCLIYVDSNKQDLFQREEEKENENTTTVESLLERLPDDLKDYVSGDNVLFAAEKADWDEATKPKPVASPAPSAASSASCKTELTLAEMEEQQRTASGTKERLWRKDFLETVINLARKGQEPTDLLVDALDEIRKKQKEAVVEYMKKMESSVPLDGDPRCVDICSFATADEKEQDNVESLDWMAVLQWNLKHLALSALQQAPTDLKATLIPAVSELIEEADLDENQSQIHRKWVEDYQQFKKVVVVVNGMINNILEKKFTEAASYGVYVVRTNELFPSSQKVCPLLVWNLIRCSLVEMCKADMKSNIIETVEKYKRHDLYFLLNKMAQGGNPVDEKILARMEELYCHALDPDDPTNTLVASTASEKEKLNDMIQLMMDKNFPKSHRDANSILRIKVAGSMVQQFGQALHRIRESPMMFGESELLAFLESGEEFVAETPVKIESKLKVG